MCNCVGGCSVPALSVVAPRYPQDDQDGGKGGVGTVIEIAPWRGETDPFKFGVRVKWERTGHVNL